MSCRSVETELPLTRRRWLDTCRVKHPKVVPPLLQGRDGSQSASPNGPIIHEGRSVTRKLSFTILGGGDSAAEQRPRKRKVSASPSTTSESGGGASRDSRSTEVSSSSVYRCRTLLSWMQL